MCVIYTEPMDKLLSNIEALIFAAVDVLTFKDIKQALDSHIGVKTSKEEVEKAIDYLIEKYQRDDFAIEIVEISGGYRFMTKGAYYGIIATLLKQSTKKRLSKAALETLSIIAYKQPVIKSEIEKIRGVNCDYSIHKLLDKELIEILGRSTGPGKPLIYGTSKKFMDYFGLKSIDQLPRTKDIIHADSTIGDQKIEEEE